jgi:hypothetical protein
LSQLVGQSQAIIEPAEQDDPAIRGELLRIGSQNNAAALELNVDR